MNEPILFSLLLLSFLCSDISFAAVLSLFWIQDRCAGGFLSWWCRHRSQGYFTYDILPQDRLSRFPMAATSTRHALISLQYRSGLKSISADRWRILSASTSLRSFFIIYHFTVYKLYTGSRSGALIRLLSLLIMAHYIALLTILWRWMDRHGWHTTGCKHLNREPRRHGHISCMIVFGCIVIRDGLQVSQ